jgi:hypothetical protein
MKAISLTIQKIEPMLNFLKSGSNFNVKVTRSKVIIPIQRSCHKEHAYEIPITYHSKDMTNVEIFEKWVKLQCQGHKVKNLSTNRKITQMKYESHITYHSKDMANVKLFEKWVKLQDQGYKVKNYGTNRKVLS